MNRIGILHHPKVAASRPLAAQIEQWLAARQLTTWQASSHDERRLAELVPTAELLVVLGGDGSLLRAARYSSVCRVPIFGINLGRVGFLCEAQPDEWPEKLTKVLAGECWVENRLMLAARIQRNGRILHTFSVLNDVVVGRGRQARVVRFQLHVDDDHVTDYTADALIVATPTGSTAYSMAAGGPLLPPQLPNFVVVPVAPHLTFDRAIIFHEQAEIAITVQMDHQAYLTPDGTDGILLENEDVVLITKSENDCQFARVESRGYFYRRLMGRLGYSK
ncbi:NAD(+)/NADH kinase [Candidatus Leptofilum sp.]|uniref:NAD(+)/NADH kinase n=1 Tax=Candidatus Leptofilum sp. TaxID=3241576 RepID=UPI003B5CB452